MVDSRLSQAMSCGSLVDIKLIQGLSIVSRAAKTSTEKDQLFKKVVQQTLVDLAQPTLAEEGVFGFDL